jgi:hypothetical protein
MATLSRIFNEKHASLSLIQNLYSFVCALV